MTLQFRFRSPIPMSDASLRSQPKPCREGGRRRLAVQERRMMASVAAALPVPDGKSGALSDGSFPRAGNGSVRLGVSRPSWIVRTESNVRKEKMNKPNPPCVVCNGSGRIDCHHCQGRGRTNCVQLVMLPKGEWPKWCKTCRGSGLGYCDRCLGSGEYRDIMGFHFMKMSAERS